MRKVHPKNPKHGDMVMNDTEWVVYVEDSDGQVRPYDLTRTWAEQYGADK